MAIWVIVMPLAFFEENFFKKKMSHGLVTVLPHAFFEKKI